MQVELLEQAITILDTAFEAGDDLILPDDVAVGLGLSPNEPVPDPVYDMLRNKLKELKPDSRIFTDVTASDYQHAGKKVRHDPPMTSIAKASHEDRAKQEQMLFKWLADTSSKAPAVVKNGQWYEIKGKVRYPKGYYCQSFKLDGVALGLYYENGKLVRAGLRPRNGVDGEDVTEQVKYVAGIPQELKKAITCSIRGELLCFKSDFEKVQQELRAAGEDVRANPRNHTAGGIRQFKEPEKVKQMRLTFIGHALVMKNPPYRTAIERAIYCNKELGVRYVRTEPFNFEQLDEMEAKAKELDYGTDGIVVGIDNLQQQEELGNSGGSTTGTPNGLIAWKFAEERATVEIKSIEWNTGRVGAVTPVAIFDDVPLAGTMVGRATLHNAGYMIRKGIDVGTKVLVLKAGNIIPKVVGVVSDGKVKTKPKFPDKCPSCGCRTTLEHTEGNGSREEMWELLCENDECPAQNVSGLCHFLATLGILGLGESKVSALAESGIVRRFDDFFRVDIDDCIRAGLSERQGVLAVASLWMVPSPDKEKDNRALVRKIIVARRSKLQIPLWQLFAAFGIESAGKSAGKALVDHFGTFEAIRGASVAQLSEVQDIGEKTAKLIHAYLAGHAEMIDGLLNFIQPQLPVQGTLTGKTFCLSGGFPDGKKHWEKEIEARGGKIKGVGKTLTALVQGEDPGADKEEKARKYGVPIINLETLKAEYLS